MVSFTKRVFGSILGMNTEFCFSAVDDSCQQAPPRSNEKVNGIDIDEPLIVSIVRENKTPRKRKRDTGTSVWKNENPFEFASKCQRSFYSHYDCDTDDEDFLEQVNCKSKKQFKISMDLFEVIVEIAEHEAFFSSQCSWNEKELKSLQETVDNIERISNKHHVDFARNLLPPTNSLSLERFTFLMKQCANRKSTQNCFDSDELLSANLFPQSCNAVLPSYCSDATFLKRFYAHWTSKRKNGPILRKLSKSRFLENWYLTDFIKSDMKLANRGTDFSTSQLIALSSLLTDLDKVQHSCDLMVKRESLAVELTSAIQPQKQKASEKIIGSTSKAR